MSVRFNAVEIRNPNLRNVSITEKEQDLVRPAGGETYARDSGITLYRLDLPFENLKLAEKSALHTFFAATVQGMYQDFLYTDHRGGRWLVRFAQSTLEFVEIADKEASSGTFSSGGNTYPTTTREGGIWNILVILEGVELPVVFNGTMEDASHQWTSIDTANGGVHEYHADAAFAGVLGSKSTVPNAEPADRQVRCRLNLAAALSIWHIDFQLSIADLTMADADMFFFSWWPQGAVVEKLWRDGADYKFSRTGVMAYQALSKTGWNRIEMLYKPESRSGAKDGLHLAMLNGTVAEFTTRETGSAYTLGSGNNFSGPFYLNLDSGTYGIVGIDEYSLRGL